MPLLTNAEILTRARYLVDRAQAQIAGAIAEEGEMASLALEWADIAAAMRDAHAARKNTAGANLWTDYHAKAEALAAHHLTRVEMMLGLSDQAGRRAS